MVDRRGFLKAAGTAPILGMIPVADTGGESDSIELRRLCEHSLQEKYAHSPDKFDGQVLSPRIQRRLDHEIRLLKEHGLCGEFRKLWTLSRFLEKNDIPVVMQGAANGSLVVFASGLSRVCPLHFGLIVEPLFVREKWFRVDVPEKDLEVTQSFCRSLFGSAKAQIGHLKLQVNDSWFLGWLMEHSADKYGPPLDDQKRTFRFLQECESEEITTGTNKFMQRIHPTEIRHIVAWITLYRPRALREGWAEMYIGRKNQGGSPALPHPVLDEILSDTYGVWLYEEQLVECFHGLGGMSYAEGFKLINGIRKKDRGEIAEGRTRFLANAASQSLSSSAAADCFLQIERQAAICCLKAHQAGQAHTYFRRAYVLAHRTRQGTGCNQTGLT